MHLSRRIRAAPILGVALAASLIAIEGHAASLSFSVTSIGAGTTSIPRCPVGSLSVGQTLVGSSLTAVVVSAIPSECGGATVQVAANNGVTSSSGSGVVPGGGGSVSVTLSAAVPLRSSTQIDVLLTGP